MVHLSFFSVQFLGVQDMHWYIKKIWSQAIARFLVKARHQSCTELPSTLILLFDRDFDLFKLSCRCSWNCLLHSCSRLILFSRWMSWSSFFFSTINWRRLARCWGMTVFRVDIFTGGLDLLMLDSFSSSDPPPVMEELELLRMVSSSSSPCSCAILWMISFNIELHSRSISPPSTAFGCCGPPWAASASRRSWRFLYWTYPTTAIGARNILGMAGRLWALGLRRTAVEAEEVRRLRW